MLCLSARIDEGKRNVDGASERQNFIIRGHGGNVPSYLYVCQLDQAIIWLANNEEVDSLVLQVRGLEDLWLRNSLFGRKDEWMNEWIWSGLLGGEWENGFCECRLGNWLWLGWSWSGSVMVKCFYEELRWRVISVTKYTVSLIRGILREAFLQIWYRSWGAMKLETEYRYLKVLGVSYSYVRLSILRGGVVFAAAAVHTRNVI